MPKKTVNLKQKVDWGCSKKLLAGARKTTLTRQWIAIMILTSSDCTRSSVSYPAVTAGHRL